MSQKKNDQIRSKRSRIPRYSNRIFWACRVDSSSARSVRTQRGNRLSGKDDFHHPNPSRFTVNFESKPNGPDIAFHCDFRFNFGENHNVIVRNTQTNNKWGPEERAVSNFPLLQNVFFEMIFLVEQHCFKVSDNNVHLLEYKHGLQPLRKLTFLRIDGIVIITQVRYQ
ncbi:galectin-5-like [Dreissena polymorpha]|uniref:galectin-5-like n=1 Tax=Dreissena polymorpha TaxID=45954 RepID=UPI0022649280|nr:galectin-5-like [Dreissena polymorpha]